MACHLPPIPTRDRKISVTTRLSSLGEPRKVDELRREFPFPKYAIPEVVKTLFPRLQERPLEEKFPHSRGLEKLNVLYYTRGKLGEGIMRERDKLSFTVADEYNQKKVVMMSSYDPLHDPYLANYMARPSIKQHLECQGFLRDDDHVVCNLKHFNEFRKYAGTAQNDRLDEHLRREHEKDVRRQVELAELRALWKTDEAQRLEDATARKIAHDAEVRSRLNAQVCRNQDRREQAAKNRANLLYEAEECRTSEMNARNISYDRVKLPNIAERRMTMMNILQREQAADLRLLANKISVRKIRELKSLHRTQAKVNSQLANRTVRKTVQDTLELQLKTKATERSERNQRNWEELPGRIARTREEKRRIDALVRKYFYRWLNKVRQRRKRREDDKQDGHNSHWDVQDTLEKENTEFCTDRVNIVNAKTFIAAALRQMAVEADAEDDKWEIQLHSDNDGGFKKSIAPSIASEMSRNASMVSQVSISPSMVSEF